MKFSTKEVALCAILIALTTVCTMVVRIPMPGTQGYVNIGDTMIFFIALTFGKRYGLIAGGLGSALADLIGGYGIYILATLVIKGFEGFLVGYLYEKYGKEELGFGIIFCVIGAIEMVSGYALFETIYFGNWATALGSLFGNTMQGLASIVFGVVLYAALRAQQPVRRLQSALRE